MKIDLKEQVLFDVDELLLDRPVNFIFGKNGTGKSTISKLIRKQAIDKDVRIYQGIKSVITNGKLNSVTLGEDNVTAQKNIEIFEKKIVDFEASKADFENQKQDWIKKIDSKETEITRQSNKIKNFYTNSARNIKNNDLHIASTSYNQPNFKEEVKYAFHLSEAEKAECKEYLKIDEKVAKKINLNVVNFANILESTNSILEKKVEEERSVIRLNSNAKINFAQTGIAIHERGEHCSFCGNPISDEVFDELELFFSASKIKEFEIELANKIEEIREVKSQIETITISEEDFYIQFCDEVKSYKNELEIITKEQVQFLTILEEALDFKRSQLFSASSPKLLTLPKSSKVIIQQYNNVVDRNNSEDIFRLKEFSRDLLRFDLVYTYVEQFDLTTEIEQLSKLEEELSEVKTQSKKVRAQIGEIENQILETREKISIEIEKTKSEKKLATNINKKLELYVPFQLEHIETNLGEHQGYYRIRNKFSQNSEYRDIDTLSEGEKNIIGFLYFVEKLNENLDSPLDKIIIFDDPMDSNDDMMQYIIVTEIQELMKPIDKKKTKDVLVIMTHNAHFYINVKYNRLYEDGKDRNGVTRLGDRFVRLQKENSSTIIKILDSEGQDFSTSYELLWKELRFLYNSDRPNLMLNSIRRIIETFTKFNRIDNFYIGNKEAQKLFNVNSHSIDDLEAELNGKNRDQIIDLMKKCFKENQAENHFKFHWKAANK